MVWMKVRKRIAFAAVVLCIRQPLTLQFASDKLRSNKDVVLGAIKSAATQKS